MSTRLENPGGGDSCRFVADLLPPTAPDPEPARAVPFFRAFILHWLMPRRWGPHLAAGSFGRALAAHLMSMTLGAAILMAGPALEWAVQKNVVAGLQELRSNAATQVLDMAAMSAGTPVQWLVPVLIVGAIPLLQLGLLGMGTVLMPFCAGGDRAGSVWKRSVKNVYWATTIVVPIAVGIVTVQALDSKYFRNDIVAITLGLAVFIVLPVMTLRPLLVGATRYVGDPDGPAFAPRRPICDRCGYALIKLLIDGGCPECGLSVRDSLPGGRRQPTVWQREHLKLRGFGDLLRMQRAVLVDGTFFETVPVHSGMAAARHFWWGTYALMVLVSLVFLKVIHLATSNLSPWGYMLAGPAVLVVVAPFVMHGLLMFGTCMIAQTSIGLGDYRVSAIACYYGSPLLWPAMACVAVGSVLLLQGPFDRLGSLVVFVTSSGDCLTAAHLVFFLLGGLGLSALLFAFVRLGRAIHLVRYANV